MGQLFRSDSNGNTAWSTGSSHYYSNYEHGNWTYRIAVNCRLGDMENDDLALLDTGAEWSVISDDIAEPIRDQIGPCTESFSISTRFGEISGDLHRIQITLLSEQGYGQDLVIEGSVFISKEWLGPPIILGYRGFLEKIRIAIDPGVTPNEERFFFGEPG